MIILNKKFSKLTSAEGFEYLKKYTWVELDEFKGLSLGTSLMRIEALRQESIERLGRGLLFLEGDELLFVIECEKATQEEDDYDEEFATDDTVVIH